MTWVCGGGLPLTKHCFDAGNEVELGIAGDRRLVLEGTGEDGENVVDTVVGSEGRLGNV